MFDFIRKAKSKLPTVSHRSVEANLNSTQQHTDIQRELIRVVLKDTLRQHGVPLSWLRCEVVVLPKRGGDEDLIIQLIVLNWNQLLMQCVRALEQALLQGLDRFDPSVNHSRYVVSWRFAPNCGCPLNQMPEARTWTQFESVSAPAEPSKTEPIFNWRQNVRSSSPPKFDLPLSARDFMKNDFAATEPSALRQEGG
jgi:hypothetical protein